MKFGIFIFSIVFIVRAATASALELKNPEADKRRMTIELEVVPTPPQNYYDAGSDAKDAGSKSNEQLAKNKQPKPLNPMTLFRW